MTHGTNPYFNANAQSIWSDKKIKATRAAGDAMIGCSFGQTDDGAIPNAAIPDTIKRSQRKYPTRLRLNAHIPTIKAAAIPPVTANCKNTILIQDSEPTARHSSAPFHPSSPFGHSAHQILITNYQSPFFNESVFHPCPDRKQNPRRGRLFVMNLLA